MERNVQIPVECPQCHNKRFMEAEVDPRLLNSPLYQEIQEHLRAWVLSQCPDHLGIIAEMSKN